MNLLKKFSPLIYCSLILLSCLSHHAYAQVNLYTKDSQAIPYSKLISEQALKKKLMVLTSESLEGRETGTPGAEKAARYIQSIFKRDGLSPLVNQENGRKSYFLPIPLKRWVIKKGQLSFGDIELESGTDFIPVSRGANTQQDFTKSEYIIGVHQASDSTHSMDFKDTPIEDKIVLIIDQSPESVLSNFTSNNDVYRYFRRLNLNLKKILAQKPRSVFISSPDFRSMAKNEYYSNFVNTPVIGFEPSPTAKPMGIFLISPQATGQLLSKSGINMDSILKSTQPFTKLQSAPVHLNIPLKIDPASASDVIGFMEGTDLKNEVLVISAHYDHLGKHNGQIYHGADDDGSGSASMMTLVDAFAAAKKKGQGPRRSILFLANVGEEKGLLGSYYYSEHPLIPMSQTITDLNIDMIGRVDKEHEKDTNYVYVIGSGKLSSGLQTISEKTNAKFSNLKLDYTYDIPNDPNQFYYRSDHYNFARLGVPIIFYFNGVHPDYHQPTDVIEKINFGIYSKRARLVFFTAWDLANRDDRPKVDRKSDMENTR